MQDTQVHTPHKTIRLLPALLPLALIGVIGLNACQPQPAPTPPPVKKLEVRKPFGGHANAIPGTLQAEDFDEGGEVLVFTVENQPQSRLRARGMPMSRPTRVPKVSWNWWHSRLAIGSSTS
jgi:hypothetical protein